MQNGHLQDNKQKNKKEKVCVSGESPDFIIIDEFSNFNMKKIKENDGKFEKLRGKKQDITEKTSDVIMEDFEDLGEWGMESENSGEVIGTEELYKHLTDEQANSALNWQRKHERHVEKLMWDAWGEFPPSEEDAGRPELWLSENWVWFNQNRMRGNIGGIDVLGLGY